MCIRDSLGGVHPRLRVPGHQPAPARPDTPTDKAIVERTFSSINTLFCQHVAGYTGRDVTRRGQHEAAWSLVAVPIARLAEGKVGAGRVIQPSGIASSAVKYSSGCRWASEARR